MGAHHFTKKQSQDAYEALLPGGVWELSTWDSVMIYQVCLYKLL